MPPVKPPKPPTSGSNAVKPNPNYAPPASVKKSCAYSTPCGWCAKWDKKCDKKIGCGDEKPERGLRAKAGLYDEYGSSEMDDIRSGKGLSYLDANLNPNKPLPSGIRKEF
jgi:hypothetical protein